jgi:hypothetical protein
MNTDRLKFTFLPRIDGYQERSGPVTMTIPHGDSWPEILDDCVAFLRITGYPIADNWVENYKKHKELSDEARNLLEKIRSSPSEATLEITYNDERDAPPPKRSKPRRKKKKPGRKTKS